MSRLHRGIALGVLQCLLVLSVAGKYAWDRERLPRVWAKTAPIDPNLPIRGRYVSLRLEVALPRETPGGDWVQRSPVVLSVENGALMARPTWVATGISLLWVRTAMLAEPVAFFIPEHAQDPTRLGPGEELWVEVSVPRKGVPRPLRLGVKRGGILTPLALD